MRYRTADAGNGYMFEACISSPDMDARPGKGA